MIIHPQIRIAIMNIQVKPVSTHRAILSLAGQQYPAAIGKQGVTTDKREGDNKSPIGSFGMRPAYFRPDKLTAPESALPFTALSETDGWCDDPAHKLYNLPITLTFEASHEKLWRQDDVYDLIIPLGYNDDPPRPGFGSAIFMHVARPDFSGTEGCVALALPDLLNVLKQVDIYTTVEILPSE